ncbi:unnamed protein product [Ascophyllum nodosum]
MAPSRALIFTLLAVGVHSFEPGTPRYFLQQQRAPRNSIFAQGVGVSPLLSRGQQSVALVPRECLRATKTSMTESSEYLQNKEALKRDLRVEYESFFENFESNRYLPDVEFVDPVTSFIGLQKYRNNVDMLGGRTLLGKILFQDASIVLHDIEEPGPSRLRTRWTLTMCFKALPWRPVLRFTGISDYTIDYSARVVKQEDYWDSINLQEGRYAAVGTLEGVKDFVGQVLPKREDGGGDPGQLLRRGKEYDVRRVEVGGDVVALREFDEYPSDDALETNRRVLLASLSADGLKAAGEPQLLTPGARKNHQIRVILMEHDWMMT